MTLATGIFDQYDVGPGGPAAALADHIAFAIEADRLGVGHYHVTEHHGSPLSVGQPNIVLAALSQRTERIRLGVFVNILPATHPFALAEQIATLDQLSGGRINVGVGSGVSPYELGYLGIDGTRLREVYAERLPQLLELLDTGRLGDAELALRPVQAKPPIWYASSSVSSAQWAGANGVNLSGWWNSGGFAESAVAYREAAETAGFTGAAAPLLGVSSYIYIGESDGAAVDRYRRAFAHYGANMMNVWHRYDDHGADFLADPDWRLEHGHAIVGTPETVREQLAEQVTVAGANYQQVQPFFGDLSKGEAIDSLTAFMTEVLPGLPG